MVVWVSICVTCDRCGQRDLEYVADAGDAGKSGAQMARLRGMAVTFRNQPRAPIAVSLAQNATCDGIQFGH
ncbi:hypothetical protein PhaeoP97_02717 [Phaeobacter porticola]|uniref:Uncharacterized protein n=1 Tax=Phaeobacter porticola TaxID=1844006 RepID=A0A1L3I7M0_9RHOB|nr:hypothetical protein PhaeoP97_02717 [Phaeobacter porticola]